MAPNGDLIGNGVPTRRKSISGVSKPPKLSNGSLHRTLSDISFELSKETLNTVQNLKDLPPISEVEDAKCECCGMSEECTPEYIERVREKFLGKWICGLCSEAVKEEMQKNTTTNNSKKRLEEAVNAHMSACVRFNKFGRAYPALFQADAMKEMLRKRANSVSPKGPNQKKGGIARSSSCMPAITKEIDNLSIKH